MAFDFGGAFGGGLSGAATGSVFGPVGSVIGGLGGLITGGLSGGGPAAYQPTEQELAFQQYGLNQIRPPESTKKRIKAEFRQYLKSGNRGAAEAFLDQYKNMYADSKFIDKALAKSLKKPIDFGADAYRGMADTLYGQQGFDLGENDYSNYSQQAKSLGIRSPQAFADMIKQDMMARKLVETPQQEMLSYMFGPSARDESGKITNMYKKYVPLAERSSTATV